MAKHQNSIWPTRKIGVYPQQYVQTTEDGQIKISFYTQSYDLGWAVTIDRGDARLLARRLTQCLEATK